MAQSNQIVLKKNHQFSNQQLSDPELDDLEEKLTDEEPPEDIPYEEDLPEDSERRNNIPEKTIPDRDGQAINKEVSEFTRDTLNKKFPAVE
ncbi:MmgE/PrpD family protein [Nitrosomonas sp. Nm166]|uniref:MmgE/PrpD family protein n=1 Tax=Nitrosomonas sp. Nm166 TaxID=1881054 RepID=UPI0008E2CE15|nr:MmgE/PrpD family protein [Nitrosomonas sp. Nm166]SFF16726.1 hypothetical protein SAMN05428977_106112 [Nitrosomonas sp. Nm166]